MNTGTFATTGALLQLPTPDEQRADSARALFGFVPNAARLMALSPTIHDQQFDYMDHFQAHPRLNPPLLTFIRLLVAGNAGCRYCIDMNTALLVRNGIGPEAIAAARQDTGNAPLPAAELALLQLVLKAVKDPHGVSAEDIETVRRQGWEETDVFEAVHYGAHAQAVNIVFDTFKVPLDAAFAS